jgi:hypothetical protein
MRRLLFTFCSAVSLLLCGVALAEFGWNRSSYHGPRVGYPSGYGFLTYRPLGLYLASMTYLRPAAAEHVTDVEQPRRWHMGWQATTNPAVDSMSDGRTRRAFHAGAFNAGVPRNGVHEGRVRYVLLPHWFVILATALLPAVWARRSWRQRRRVAEGRCPACGYDLRATPDRCPECGTTKATAA